MDKVYRLFRALAGAAWYKLLGHSAPWVQLEVLRAQVEALQKANATCMAELGECQRLFYRLVHDQTKEATRERFNVLRNGSGWDGLAVIGYKAPTGVPGRYGKPQVYVICDISDHLAMPIIDKGRDLIAASIPNLHGFAGDA